MDDAESFSDYPAVPEEPLDLTGRKGSTDVEVFWGMAKHDVTKGPAYQIGFASCTLDFLYGPKCIPIYHAVSDGMLLCCIYLADGNRLPVFVCLIPNEHDRHLNNYVLLKQE